MTHLRLTNEKFPSPKQVWAAAFINFLFLYRKLCPGRNLDIQRALKCFPLRKPSDRCQLRIYDLRELGLKPHKLRFGSTFRIHIFKFQNYVQQFHTIFSKSPKRLNSFYQYFPVQVIVQQFLLVFYILAVDLKIYHHVSNSGNRSNRFASKILK